MNEQSVTVANELAVYSIPECNLSGLTERIEKLNRRAKRIGVSPVVMVSSFLEVRTKVCVGDESYWLNDASLLKTHGHVTESKMAWHTVTLTGESPKYDGWSFVAALEPLTTDDGATENIIRTVPGQKCPTEFSDRIGQCDHCNKSRRRNATFVVRHESGEHKVVGRNCIADFLGGVDPHQIANRAEWLISIDELARESEGFDGEYGSSSPTGDMLDRMLSYAASTIEKLGWVSKGRAYADESTSTASIVSFLLSTPRGDESRKDKELRAELAYTADHSAIAESAIEWASTQSDDDCENSDYLSNIRLIAKCEWCRFKNMGYAVSIVSSYLKNIDQLKEAERRAARPDSEHVGVIKKRMEMTVTVDRVIANEGHYGTTGIHKMVDDKGNDIVWFSSGDWLAKGSTYRVKATPKKHDDYNGRPQTIVSRVAVIHELDDDGKPIEVCDGEPSESELATEKVW